jgi:hypothetical protein
MLRFATSPLFETMNPLKMNISETIRSKAQIDLIEILYYSWISIN